MPFLQTEDVSAIAGSDYTAVEGTLVFEQGQTEKSIRIPIIDDTSYEKDESFKLILTNATNDATFAETTDGGIEKEIAVVTIISDEMHKGMIDNVMILMHINKDRVKLGSGNWGRQFREAIYVHGGLEGFKPSPSDYATHTIMLPWKIIFAFVPPTDFIGGWASFVISLGMIALVTMAIGDIASMLGCVLMMPDAVTTITLVALGTSLPDTFASMTSAVQVCFRF